MSNKNYSRAIRKDQDFYVNVIQAVASNTYFSRIAVKKLIKQIKQALDNIFDVFLGAHFALFEIFQTVKLIMKLHSIVN